MSTNTKITPNLSIQGPLNVVSQDNTQDNTEDDPDPHTKSGNGIFFRDNRKDVHVPGIVSRADPEGKNDKTESTNDAKKPLHPNGNPAEFFPPPPSVGIDIDTVETPLLPDVNVYQHKKTFAQGMMDLALFSANANQLRYVLESFSGHPYYYPSIVLISFSLIMQVSDLVFIFFKVIK